MNLERVREVLATLSLPEGDYALHGSGPLLAHGIVAEVNDVDIVSRGTAWQYATTLGTTSRGVRDDVVRPLPGVEIYDGWLGADADELIDGASMVAGLPCVSLRAVLEFKRRMNRPKDRSHIELIERYLANLEG